MPNFDKPEFFLDDLVLVAQLPLMQILIFLLVLDVLTGTFKAMKNKEVSSRIGTTGLMKHALVLVTTCGVYAFTIGLNMSVLGHGYVILMALNQVQSLLENWEETGIYFPEFLKPMVNTLKKRQNETMKSIAEIHEAVVTPKEEGK